MPGTVGIIGTLYPGGWTGLSTIPERLDGPVHHTREVGRVCPPYPGGGTGRFTIPGRLDGPVHHTREVGRVYRPYPGDWTGRFTIPGRWDGPVHHTREVGRVCPPYPGRLDGPVHHTREVGRAGSPYAGLRRQWGVTGVGPLRSVYSPRRTWRTCTAGRRDGTSWARLVALRVPPAGRSASGQRPASATLNTSGHCSGQHVRPLQWSTRPATAVVRHINQ